MRMRECGDDGDHASPSWPCTVEAPLVCIRTSLMAPCVAFELTAISDTERDAASAAEERKDRAMPANAGREAAPSANTPTDSTVHTRAFRSAESQKHNRIVIDATQCSLPGYRPTSAREAC